VLVANKVRIGMWTLFLSFFRSRSVYMYSPIMGMHTTPRRFEEFLATSSVPNGRSVKVRCLIWSALFMEKQIESQIKS